jgi:peptidoglycan/xylan/chitin deacetylase (PgdA/CDA1 family)
MYHGFTDNRAPVERFALSRSRLIGQLLLLRLLGYRSLSLDALVEHLRASRPLPPRAVVLTVDDCYADAYRIAFPWFRRFGFQATFFAISGRLGQRDDPSATSRVAGRALMDAEQLANLRTAGMSVGAHTRSHPRLSTLDDRAVEREVAGSREELEQALGAPVTHFAYPYGDYDERSVAAAARAGFTAACTCHGGRNDLATSPLELRRIEVKGGDGVRVFLRKVAGSRR